MAVFYLESQKFGEPRPTRGAIKIMGMVPDQSLSVNLDCGLFRSFLMSIG